MKNKIKDYWNKRAKDKLLAGSNTVTPDLLETNFLISFIKKDKKILDIGCGNGIFLERLSKKIKFKSALGIDYSAGMIFEAKKRKLKRTKFEVIDMTNKNQIKSINQKFDYIISKRSLINLSSFAEQTKVLENFSDLLNKHGRILCCENSLTALKNINSARKKINLKKIVAPWHNKYIDNKKLIKFKFKKIRLVKLHEFSSSFYFISRILNAFNSKIQNKKRFNKQLNQLAFLIDQSLIPGYSQNILFEFKKK